MAPASCVEIWKACFALYQTCLCCQGFQRVLERLIRAPVPYVVSRPGAVSREEERSVSEAELPAKSAFSAERRKRLSPIRPPEVRSARTCSPRTRIALAAVRRSRRTPVIEPPKSAPVSLMPSLVQANWRLVLAELPVARRVWILSAAPPMMFARPSARHAAVRECQRQPIEPQPQKPGAPLLAPLPLQAPGPLRHSAEARSPGEFSVVHAISSLRIPRKAPVRQKPESHKPGTCADSARPEGHDSDRRLVFQDPPPDSAQPTRTAGSSRACSPGQTQAPSAAALS